MERNKTTLDFNSKFIYDLVVYGFIVGPEVQLLAVL